MIPLDGFSDFHTTIQTIPQYDWWGWSSNWKYGYILTIIKLFNTAERFKAIQEIFSSLLLCPRKIYKLYYICSTDVVLFIVIQRVDFQDRYSAISLFYYILWSCFVLNISVCLFFIALSPLYFFILLYLEGENPHSCLLSVPIFFGGYKSVFSESTMLRDSWRKYLVESRKRSKLFQGLISRLTTSWVADHVKWRCRLHWII